MRRKSSWAKLGSSTLDSQTTWQRFKISTKVRTLWPGSKFWQGLPITCLPKSCLRLRISLLRLRTRWTTSLLEVFCILCTFRLILGFLEAWLSILNLLLTFCTERWKGPTLWTTGNGRRSRYRPKIWWAHCCKWSLEIGYRWMMPWNTRGSMKSAKKVLITNCSLSSWKRNDISSILYLLWHFIKERSYELIYE